MVEPQFILASASPRRADLLRQIGLTFKVVATDIEEPIDTEKGIWSTVLELAKAKACACQTLLSASIDQSLPILAADTLVQLDQNVLGKPTNAVDAMRILRLLSGKVHQVYTGVAALFGGEFECTVASASVEMRGITEREITEYCNSGEPFDKAGAYGLQGIGGIFVEKIEGQPSTVAGLPLRETEEILRRSGVDTWRYRRSASL